jgi:hypothetical protein
MSFEFLHDGLNSPRLGNDLRYSVTTPMRGLASEACGNSSGRPVIADRPRARSSTPAANNPTVSSVHE